MKVKITNSALLKDKIGQICAVAEIVDMGAYVWMPSGNKVFLFSDEYEEL